MIKNIYLSNDQKLINLFMNNPSTKLPIPGIEVFDGGPIPELIQKRQRDIQASIDRFFKNPSLGTEVSLVEIQRKFRGKRRQQEEKARLKNHPAIVNLKMSDEDIQYIKKEKLKDANIPFGPEEQTLFYIEDALKNANTPYWPFNTDEL